LLAVNASAQTPSPRDLANRMKPELRERALSVLDESSEVARIRSAAALARTSPSESMDFLISVLSTDRSVRLRHAIIKEIEGHSLPGVREVLEKLAASDPDAGVAILALEALRARASREMRAMLVKRIEMARRDNDKEGLELLAAEHERWISITRGTMLPAFLRAPAGEFSLKASDLPVRVLAFGDFGTGSEPQKKVAAVMREYHRQAPFDFGITLGDNFYPSGMKSPTDERWQTWYGDLYDPLGIKIYASLGNHDWYGVDSPAAEILYSDRSPSWRLPSPYYTFNAGPVQFFALDTNEMSEAQFMWLDREISKSRARWRVVYGHHPIYSAGAHGDTPALIARLLPLLKDRVDVYIAGHEHDMQHLKPDGGVHFFIAGGGGQMTRPLQPGPRSVFARAAHGFAVLEADRNRLKITFIGTDSKPMHEHALQK
jgi:tartrate-resistant acid phosphatase type 5